MKKKKEEKRTIGNFYSPYQEYDDDMKAWFDAYKNDSEKIIEIDGKVYSKIIHRCEIYIYYDFTILVAFEPRDELRIGDMLVDENGQEFRIKSFEMFRYAGEIPEWTFKISSIAIIGEEYSIGDYLAKK